MRSLLAGFFLLWMALSVQAARIGLLVSGGPERQEVVAVARDLASRFRLEGLPLWVKFYDPGRDGRQALSVIRKARNQEVRLLIGPLNPRANGEVILAARAYGIPVILLTGDVDPIKIPGEPFRGVFRTGLSPRMAAKGLLRCIAGQGRHHLRLLLSLNDEGRLGLRWLKLYAWEYRLRIEKVVWFGPGDTYLYPKFEALLGADAVIIWCDQASALRVARALALSGLHLPVFWGPQIASETLLSENSDLWNQPFPATGLYLPEKRSAFPFPLDLRISALIDAFYLAREILLRGHSLSEHTLESLGRIDLPGGTYYLSSDDHYGLLPQSVGLFTYGPEGFRPYCPPGHL
ncbi:ABC transporter substrate-binding protein [Thermosulfurimonas sp.]|uniref:ABC transporter substrate-binding protein n=1 Tax=Thermosulfurimonas sp. TaxID=2080236 RepID=UPI0025D5CDA8|nr:ABC transporter substrate-binding protein [Thermosulfurimonas sp.]